MLQAAGRTLRSLAQRSNVRYIHDISGQLDTTSTFQPWGPAITRTQQVPKSLQSRQTLIEPTTIPVSLCQRTGDGYDASAIAMVKQASLDSRPSQAKENHLGGRKRLKTSHQKSAIFEGSNEEILQFEVIDLLARSSISLEDRASPRQDDASAPSDHVPLEPFAEIELQIEEISSTGNGLALSPDQKHVYVVPFSVPGDRVLARVTKPTPGQSYTQCDFVEVRQPSTKRAGVIPGCKYFATCSGCQFQMLPYSEQLAHKKTVVERAYQRFSNLIPEQIPKVEETMGSPLQYGYRTKLTPHFNEPKKVEVSNGDGVKKERRFTSVPEIGFIASGRRRIIDIESCPISTPIVEAGLTIERQKVAQRLDKYRKGATILLRETTERTSTRQNEADEKDTAVTEQMDTRLPHHPRLIIRHPTHTDTKTYTNDHRATIKEYVGKYVFESNANSFFQNNNSILEPCLDYIRSRCQPPTPIDSSNPKPPPITYLLDAYCGSGLFAIGLSSMFSSVLGIEIDSANVEKARTNAELNNVTNAGFINSDAKDLFADVPYPPEQTLLVIDPPRKGASVDFLKQLCIFGPKRVIYVSCNVHTQARDVGMLVNGFGALQSSEDGEQKEMWRYKIESLRGFDFFPQTGHVEGVCVLNRAQKSPTLPVSKEKAEIHT